MSAKKSRSTPKTHGAKAMGLRYWGDVQPGGCGNPAVTRIVQGRRPRRIKITLKNPQEMLQVAVDNGWRPTAWEWFLLTLVIITAIAGVTWIGVEFISMLGILFEAVIEVAKALLIFLQVVLTFIVLGIIFIFVGAIGALGGRNER